jgi:importin subunit beta-1
MKQDEELAVDDDIRTLSRSGASCLTLVAATVKDDVVPVIMPFVKQNIQSENWRNREAATS